MIARPFIQASGDMSRSEHDPDMSRSEHDPTDFHMTIPQALGTLPKFRLLSAFLHSITLFRLFS